MLKFPHLDTDSKFPYLDNVEVYKYDNHFDYSRFDFDQMEITICSVPWDMGEAHIGNRTISGIGNVVAFENQGDRDKWFNDLPDSDCFRFTTKYRQLHRENKIGVPIPFDVASNFNYVAVTYKQMANESSPVEFESSSARRKWFWFIREVEFVAPNSTILHLIIDAWQTFIYDLDITSMILERGHAPMNAMKATQYLTNPIANNCYLLTEDVNFGSETVVRNCEYMPVGNGRKYCLFALPMTQNNLQYSGNATSGTSSPPYFADDSSRWGNQLIVDGYEWEYVNNYSNVTPTIQSLVSRDGLAYNGNGIFAVRSEDANLFFNALASTHMHVLNAIQAVFIVDEAHLQFDGSFTLTGYTVYNVTSKTTTRNITLTKSMFDFPTVYANIAKLYTYPYSVLEYTDDDGLTVELQIENTGNLSFVNEISIAFPYIQQRVFLKGANGSDSKSYVWKTLGNNDTSASLPVDDFSKFMSQWDIPTFALYVRRDKADAPGEYAAMQARRYAAVTDYENTTRIANTVYENGVDSQATMVSNVSATGATDTANVARSTAKDVANTSATQSGLILNKDDLKNANDEKVDTYGGGFVSQIGGGGGYLGYTYAAQLQKLSDDTDADRILMAQMQGITADTITSSAVVNAAGSIGGGIASGAMTGSAAGIPGAAVGATVGAIAQAANTGASTMIALTNNANINTVNEQHALAKFSSARANAMSLTQAQIDYNHSVKDVENTYLESTVSRFSATNGITNANAQRDKTALDANASATQATNNANAARTQSTENANGDYSRDAIVTNGQNTLRLKQYEEWAKWQDLGNSQPVVMTQYTGDAYQDVFKRRGVRLNVRTQSRSAIASAGDEFLRYGYMLEQQWEFDGNWNVMPYFTYWKLRDFWIKSLNVPDMYVDRIRFFLYGGVTVWRRPEDIGTKTIYDNFS